MSAIDKVRLKRILFLQKPEFLSAQKAEVSARLQAALPGIEVAFAGNANEIVEGSQFDAVIAPTLPWLADAMNRISGCHWLHLLSAGADKLWAMPFPREGLLITSSSGVHGPPISEYVIGAMLYFSKRFAAFAQQSQEKRWERAWLQELTGQTVLVIGLGHIGEYVARRARAFDMRVLGVRRNPRPSEFVERVYSLDNMPSILSECDFVVVCLPLTDATAGIINAEFVARLKHGAVLVDVSRGGIVNEQDLTAALDSGRLAGAALDVFETQPLPQTSPLWGRGDVLLTPHVSGTSQFYLARALEIFVNNANAIASGSEPPTRVDDLAGY